MQSDQTVVSLRPRFEPELSWSSIRRVRLPRTFRVLNRVRGILNKLTPENFDLLKEQLIHSGITTNYIIFGVVSMIYHKAVHEPIYCPMYAQLCSVLSNTLPRFPPDQRGGGELIKFRRLLLNFCQEAFERAYRPEERLLKLGNIRLIGELWSRRLLTDRIVHEDVIMQLLGRDKESCPEEENVEAICLLFNRIGKQLDANQKAKRINDLYFGRLKDISVNPLLTPRIRFMVLDVIDLRGNNWLPRREEVKPKTIAEIHLEAESDMGLRPGAIASLRSVYY